jgi:hypothetical protein
MLKSLSFTTAIFALGILATPASAAPASGLQGAEAGTGASATEQVAYRRCWWHRGHRHCRWVDTYSYGPSINLHIGGGRHGHRHRHHRHHGHHHRGRHR